MVAIRHPARALLDEILLGTGVGLVVLGVGGRAVMYGIAVATGVPPVWTVGGSVSVIACGAAAGAAGALMYALAGVAASWGAGGRGWVRFGLFAAMLGLVTVRGLNGSPAGPAAAFYPLVLMYGVWFAYASARRAQRRLAGSGASVAPTVATSG